mgnify:CR=1 FL=1
MVKLTVDPFANDLAHVLSEYAKPLVWQPPVDELFRLPPPESKPAPNVIEVLPMVRWAGSHSSKGPKAFVRLATLGAADELSDDDF